MSRSSPPTRVRKLVGDSAHILPDLLGRGERFDLVFVDGSDVALDVLVDAALSWQLLASDGVLIFDNYLWRSPLGEDPLLHPQAAVDAFVGLLGLHGEVIQKGTQLILRRTGR